MQPFFRTDSGEVADGKRVRVGAGTGPAMACKVDAGVDDVDAFAGDRELLRHIVGVVVASGDEAVDLAAVVADQLH